MDQKQQNAERLTDKAFTRVMLTSVLWILLCLFGLCSATWALFGADVTSTDNRLVAGSFDLTATVTHADTAEAITVKKMENGVMSCTLQAAGRYTVTLTVAPEATVLKGHCHVTVGSVSHKTAAIYAGEGKGISFTIEAQNAPLTVYFVPTWGLPAEFDVGEGGILPIPSPQGQN